MKIKRFNQYSLNEMKIDFLGRQFYLREYPQHKDIPYNKSCACDNCGYANFFKRKTYDIVGYCSTSIGYMAIFECLQCGEKYKHHVSPDKYDLDDFKESIGMTLKLKSKDKDEVPA